MATDVRYLISLQDKFSGKINTINKSTQGFDRSLGRTIARFVSFAAVGAVFRDRRSHFALQVRFHAVGDRSGRSRNRHRAGVSRIVDVGEGIPGVIHGDPVDEVANGSKSGEGFR